MVIHMVIRERKSRNGPTANPSLNTPLACKLDQMETARLDRPESVLKIGPIYLFVVWLWNSIP